MTTFSSGLFLVTLAVMAIGLVSIVFPFLPATLVIWLGIFLYGVGTNFETISTQFLLTVSLLAIGTVILDYIMAVWGHRKYHGSLWGILGAIVGAFIGAIFGNFAGFVLGPIFGAIIFELLRGHDNIFSIKTERFTIVGYIGGTLVKFAASVAMIGLFLWELAQHPAS